MDAAVRLAVRRRAADRCEYCRRRQCDSPVMALHIEHIVPRKHGGGDALDNLAAACSECNLRKGSNLTGRDPDNNQITPLFNPRTERWADHFSWDGLRIVGLSAVGRTTVRVLDLNAASRLRVRLAAGLNDL
jgi:5-methylcytosine-specific restriction endonuclease McrA